MDDPPDPADDEDERAAEADDDAHSGGSEGQPGLGDEAGLQKGAEEAADVDEAGAQLGQEEAREEGGGGPATLAEEAGDDAEGEVGEVDGGGGRAEKRGGDGEQGQVEEDLHRQRGEYAGRNLHGEVPLLSGKKRDQKKCYTLVGSCYYLNLQINGNSLCHGAEVD